MTATASGATSLPRTRSMPSTIRTPTERNSHARSARARDRPSSLARHRSVARAHGLRRLRRRQGVEALVPVVLDPGLFRLRGEPADAEAVWYGHAPAERGRVPHERRRDQEHRDPRRDAARGDGEPARADELVLLDRQPGLRLARPPYDLHGDLPARHREVRREERRQGDEAGGRSRAPEWDQRARDGARPARG